MIIITFKNNKYNINIDVSYVMKIAYVYVEWPVLESFRQSKKNVQFEFIKSLSN